MQNKEKWEAILLSSQKHDGRKRTAVLKVHAGHDTGMQPRMRKNTENLLKWEDRSEMASSGQRCRPGGFSQQWAADSGIDLQGLAGSGQQTVAQTHRV